MFSHKELKELSDSIITGDTLSAYARRRFWEITCDKDNNLWNNAFKGIRFSAEYKERILDWAFCHFCEKIRNGQIKHIDSFSGAIVNTLREAGRKYKDDILIDSYLNISGIEFEHYDNYIQGINPFENPETILLEKEERLLREKRIKIIFRCFDELKDSCKKIIVYKYWEGLTHEEIVQKEDTDVRTVQSSRVKLSNCMNELRSLCFKMLRK